MDCSIADFFIKTIKSFVQNSYDVSIDDLTVDQLDEIFHLAKTQDVSHLVSFVFKNIKIHNEEIAKRLNEKYFKEIDFAVFRGTQIDYELERVSTLLSDNAIKFIPLKGAVIRNLYPETWMRTSCDIDILVQNSFFGQACSVLEENDYKEEARTSHDISYFSPAGSHVELHFDLIEDEKLSSCSSVLASAWDNAKPINENNFQYVFSNEFFLFYHLAHMAKHFLTGGCGVRSFLDYYLLRKSCQLDNEKFMDILTNSQLAEFENEVWNLCRCWFEGGEFNDTSKAMHEYILLGGVLGDVDNMVSVQKTKMGSGIKYIFSRLFVPYSVLAKTYPKLKKHKWLTPYYQVKRWIKFLFRGGIKKSSKELNANKNISKENFDQKNKLLTQLRLK